MAAVDDRSTSVRSAARDALPIWLATRVGIALMTIPAAWRLTDSNARNVPSFIDMWDRWDVGLFVKIARFGYFGDPQHYPDCCTAAYFPALPMLMRGVHVLVPNWVAAGLLISLVAGAVAVCALGALGRLEGGVDGREVGQRAVLYLVVMPYAVFLFAGYSEALFLAFALPSWLAAREGRWRSAGLLAAAAMLAHVTGVFLALALVVEYVVVRRRPRPDALWLAAPFAALAGHVVWMHSRTGDWLAWQHAQQIGWTTPWRSFLRTYDAARDPSQPGAFAWSFRAEIVAVLVGIALVGVLLAQRRWAESVYIGGQLVVLATSEFYLSVARTALLWFPLYLLLARFTLRRPQLHAAVLWVSTPLMAAGVLAFTTGRWVG